VPGEDQKAVFALTLEDEMSTAAKTMQQSLEALKGDIDADSRALASMQKAMRNLQGGSTVNIEQFRKLKTAIDAKKQSIARAQTSYLSLGGTFAKTGPAASSFTARMAALSKQSQAVPGPLNSIIAKLGAIKMLVAGGGAIAVGVFAIVAALTALVVAVGVAVVALYKYGVAAGDARRNEKLHLEGLAKMRYWYQRIPANAKEMQDGIDRVAASSSLGRAEIAKYSQQLTEMGFRGKNLSETLEGVAIKASTQGDAAAMHFAGMAATINLAGGSVTKLANNVKARLGGIAQRQLESTEVQAKKTQEAYAALFSGLEIDKYLTAWKGVNDLMSQSTEMGQSLKQIVELILQPLINDSTAAAPIVKRFFQGVILSAQGLLIAVLELRLWFKKTFGDKAVLDGINGQSAAVRFGKIALWGMIAALVVASALVVGLSIKLTMMLVPALGRGTWALMKYSASGLTGAIKGMWRFAASAWSMVPAMWAAIAPLLPFIIAALAVGWAVYTLIDRWDELKQAFADVDWVQAGKDILMGIIEGLVPAPLLAAIRLLGGSALEAFNTAIGSHSPSKLFAVAGLSIPQGVEAGIKKGAPGVQAAADDVVAPRVAPVGAGETSSSSASSAPQVNTSAPITIDVGGIHVHSDGKPEDVANDVERRVEALFERIALQLGARVAGAT